MALVEHWVFVSYETGTGLNLARLAKMRLQTAGYSGWVWHDDSPFGEYSLEVIAENVKAFPDFLYVCTAASHESEGQKRERNWALTFNKDPIVIAFDLGDVSAVLAHCHVIKTTNVEFQDACDSAATEITRRNNVRVPTVVDAPAGAEAPLPDTISEPEGETI